MISNIKSFLHAYWDGVSPLLLGYSGGVDSKALLYALIELGVKPLHVAHVDHHWREESGREACEIAQEMDLLNIPFHTVQLEKISGKNREAVYREKRLLFFASLFEKVPFQALLLAHHADDLAETALKRVLEGAHLSSLGGMEKASFFGSMPVWRPLLSIKKKELSLFLESKGLTPFFDATNLDPAYLRSRMRLEMLPFLHKSFGKEFLDNLCLLSARANELQKYLQKKVASAVVRKEKWGVAVFCGGWEKIELRHLMQKLAEEEGVVLSRAVLETLLDWSQEPLKMRKLCLESHWIVSGRLWTLFLPRAKEAKFPGMAFVRGLVKY